MYTVLGIAASANALCAFIACVMVPSSAAQLPLFSIISSTSFHSSICLCKDESEEIRHRKTKEFSIIF